MKTSTIVMAVLGCLILFAGCNGCSNYNSFVSAEENTKNSWAEVQSAYQRRADLIPSLVETVKGYANFEKSTLVEVTEARANATRPQINLQGVDLKNVTPEQFQAYQMAQQSLGGTLSRLLVAAEAYPELKADKGFNDLRSQLEGTENRIKVARDDYSRLVKPYNLKVRHFPGKIWANLFGFGPMPYYESFEGSDKAPVVKFW